MATKQTANSSITSSTNHPIAHYQASNPLCLSLGERMKEKLAKLIEVKIKVVLGGRGRMKGRCSTNNH